MLSRPFRILLVLAGLVFVGYGAAKLVVAHRDRAYGSTYGARIVHYRLDSRLVHTRLAEIAIVPPAGRSSGRLLVLLHGRHDHGGGFLGIGATSGPDTLLRASLLRALAGLGARRPTVVLLNGGSHSYDHDRRDGAWGSMLLREAIPDAERRFGTRGRVAVGGISMGGFGALHLAAVAPRTFCAVGVRSAALWRSGGETPQAAFDDAADFDRTDVFAAARRGRFRGVPLWVDDGDHDPFLAADTAFAHEVGAVFHVWPGAHTYAYWDAHVGPWLAFFARACRWRTGGG